MIRIITVALVVTTLGPAWAAGDKVAGRQKALGICQACHGLDGVTRLPDGPNIGGQNEIYLVKTLKDYKAGARKDERMSVVVQDLSERDIANVAAFYASLQPKNERE